MNTKFDEFTRSLARSVTRRGALKKCGIGLAGMALACFGLATKSEANPNTQCDACINSCVGFTGLQKHFCRKMCSFYC